MGSYHKIAEYHSFTLENFVGTADEFIDSNHYRLNHANNPPISSMRTHRGTNAR